MYPPIIVTILHRIRAVASQIQNSIFEISFENYRSNLLKLMKRFMYPSQSWAVNAFEFEITLQSIWNMKVLIKLTY